MKGLREGVAVSKIPGKYNLREFSSLLYSVSEKLPRICIGKKHSLETSVQSNPDIRMSFGDSKIKDIVGYPYIENDVN